MVLSGGTVNLECLRKLPGRKPKRQHPGGGWRFQAPKTSLLWGPRSSEGLGRVRAGGTQWNLAMDGAVPVPLSSGFLIVWSSHRITETCKGQRCPRGCAGRTLPQRLCLVRSHALAVHMHAHTHTLPLSISPPSLPPLSKDRGASVTKQLAQLYPSSL